MTRAAVSQLVYGAAGAALLRETYRVAAAAGKMTPPLPNRVNNRNAGIFMAGEGGLRRTALHARYAEYRAERYHRVIPMGTLFRKCPPARHIHPCASRFFENPAS